MNNFRVKTPLKSFRDLEVYQKTIFLSNQLNSLDFIGDERFILLTEKIPRLIAESYGDRFESIDLAQEKMSRVLNLITSVITKLDLLREKLF